MPHIEWKDEFSVGVALIDDDHKQLLAIVNRLSDALEGAAPARECTRICDELIAHTLAHFGHEEGWFEATHYPRAAEHRLMHEQLKKRILDYRGEIGQSPPPLAKFVFFTDWLAHHIVGEDKQFGAHLNGRGIH